MKFSTQQGDVVADIRIIFIASASETSFFQGPDPQPAGLVRVRRHVASAQPPGWPPTLARGAVSGADPSSDSGADRYSTMDARRGVLITQIVATFGVARSSVHQALARS